MTLFIPEWHRVSGSELHTKRVLAGLDDAHVVRRPLRPLGCPADAFVHHPDKGWLALHVSMVRFADVDPTQLFQHPQRDAFEQRLTALAHLGLGDDDTVQAVPALVVMWACSTDEARALGRTTLSRHGIRLVSREQFMQLGMKLVAGLQEPLPDSRVQALLAAYFPEAEIAPEQTTQRHVVRDNSARLQRFFLDRDQEWATKLDLDLELPEEQARLGADFALRLVNGVAGSGKTLIALHRALLLAERFPGRRVLLLIHNTPIVADLQDKLLRTRGKVPNNLELMTFFSWATRQWKQVFGRWPVMVSRPLDLIRHHRLRWPELKFDDDQLARELDFIDEMMLDTEAQYMAASRAGRGFALRAVERGQVWALRQAVAESLRQRGELAWSALPAVIVRAARVGQQHEVLERREHILVDEAQFFAPSWFALVKLSLAPGGHLFLCADPKQGFLGHRTSWKSAGLDVAGRTKRLTRSYRTTRMLLQTATAMVESLTTGDATDDEVQPDYTLMSTGTRPLLLYVATPQDAVDRLVNEIDALVQEDLRLEAFLVLFGENVNRQALYRQLGRRLGARRLWRLNETEHKKRPPGDSGADCLRVAALDTATGLEGVVVFLIGIENLFSADGAVDGERREHRLRKLYMAMTRAGQKLVLLSSQRLPPSVESLFDQPA